MSTSIELASAYLSLVPSLRGAEGHITRELQSPRISAAADGAGRSIGSRIASAAGKALKGVAIGVGAVTAAVGAVAVKGGIDRALNIEDAQAKLRGLGHDSKSLEAIMGSALGAVRGTAFGLDAAATSAAGAVAAGIKPGQELEKYLKLTADAATIAGVSMGEMGSIMNRVQTSGKAYTEDLNMLADRGIPIFQWLADEYGVTSEALRKMVADGEVDAETYRKVIEENIGGAALASGDTTRGAWANTLAALSRMGVTLTSSFLPHVKGVLGEAMVIIDGLNDRIAPTAERFAEWFGVRASGAIEGFGERTLAFVDRTGPKVIGFFTRVKDGAQGLYDLVVKGDYSGALYRAFGWEEDSPVVGKILEIRDAAASFFDELRSGEGLGAAFSDIWDSLKVVAPAIFDARQELPGLTDAVRVGAGVLGWMADNIDLVVKALPFLLVGLAGWKTLQVANNLLGRNSVIGNGALIASNFALAASYRQIAASQVAATGATRSATGAQVAETAAKNGGILANIRAAATSVAHRAAMIASTVATHALAAGQRILNLVMRANPIGLVITGLVLLGTALVTAYKKSETFRNIVQGAWNGMKVAANAVWTFLRDNVFAPLGLKVVAVATWFGDTRDKVSTAWGVVKSVLKAGWDWISTNVFDPFGAGVDRLVGWVESGRDSMGAAWEDVKAIFASPINWVIRNVWNGGIKRVFDTVADAIGLSTRLPGISEINVGGGGSGGGSGRAVQARAKGGPVRPGEPYVVGELGPELIFPDRAGWVATAAQTARIQNGWSQANPPHGGVGGWFSDRWEDVKSGARWVADGVRDAAGNVVKWVRGGLAKAAGIVLNPLKGLVDSTLVSRGGFGELVGGTVNRTIDNLIDWVRGEDEGAAPDPGGRALRGAQAHVNAAAFALADQVGGIRTMQAFNQSMAGGHPKGLAVDFIDSRSKLDQLAEAIVRTGGFDRFKYMAWQGRLWSPGQGWRAQGRGYGNDPFHRWHVHGEWFDQGGTLMPGLNVVRNATGKKEHLANVTDAVNRGTAGQGGGNHYDFRGAQLGYSKEDLVRQLDRRDRQALVRHNLVGSLR